MIWGIMMNNVSLLLLLSLVILLTGCTTNVIEETTVQSIERITPVEDPYNTLINFDSHNRPYYIGRVVKIVYRYMSSNHYLNDIIIFEDGLAIQVSGADEFTWKLGGIHLVYLICPQPTSQHNCIYSVQILF